MKLIRPRYVAILFATMILCFGVGKVFDSRCEGGCLNDAFANSTNWNNKNFNFSYDRDDEDEDNDSNRSGNNGADGPDADAAPALPPMEEIDTVVIQSVSTDWVVNATDVKPDLFLTGTHGKDRWKLVKIGKTLTIDVKPGAAKNAVLNIPKSFNGSLEIHTVSGEVEVLGKISLQKLLIESASGNVDFSSWPSEKLTLNTISGDIRSVQSARDTVPKSLALNSVSGDIRLEINNNFENFRARTVSGDLHLRVAKMVSFAYEMTTVSGSFESVPGGNKDNGIGSKQYSGKFGEPASAQLYFDSISGDFELEAGDSVSDH